MNREDELKLETAIKENMEKVRSEGLAAGAKGISGAIMEICNDKTIKNDTIRINKIRDFCMTGLGLKKEINDGLLVKATRKCRAM